MLWRATTHMMIEYSTRNFLINKPQISGTLFIQNTNITMTHLSLSVADQIKGRFRIGGTFYLVVHSVGQEAYITIHGREDKILLQCKRQ